MIVNAQTASDRSQRSKQRQELQSRAMIVHIVFWKLHEQGLNGKSRQENADEMKRLFAALKPQIPGMLRCEIHTDILRTPDSVDVVLYSEFESRAALDAYQPHPAHKEIMNFLKDVRYERRVIDYEV
jgi:quinol monooxygenase YgiN